MARITVCDWCKEKFPELVHNILIDHFNKNDGQEDHVASRFEICSGCRQTIKAQLESFELPKKPKATRSSNENTTSGPQRICQHNMEIVGDGNIMKCSVCGKEEKL